MNERKRNAWIGVGLKPWPIADKELQQPQSDIPSELGEAIGSAAVMVAIIIEEATTVAIDDQAPRSWDLHKSGW